MRVWIVINPELGWDNVVGVFSSDLPKEDLDRAFPDPYYYVSCKVVESSLEEFLEEEEE